MRMLSGCRRAIHVIEAGFHEGAGGLKLHRVHGVAQVPLELKYMLTRLVVLSHFLEWGITSHADLYINCCRSRMSPPVHTSCFR